MRMYGADLAVPLKWLTFKGESAYFTSRTPNADEYALYVVQLGRETPRYAFSAGYAGENVTAKRTQLKFAPDRGLAASLPGPGNYNIDAKRGVSFETAARANGLVDEIGVLGKVGTELQRIGGFHAASRGPTDFLGQYRRNSFFNLALRYSFD